MQDDVLDWLDAALLLANAAKAIWPSLDTIERMRLLIFMESQGRHLLSLAEALREGNE